MLDEMQAGGVDKALFQASCYYPCRREAIDLIHRRLDDLTRPHAGRFRFTATLRPPEQGPGTTWDLMQNVRLIELAHAQYGICGIHIQPAPWGTPPNAKIFYPAYAKCVELGLAVFVYVGMPGPLWPISPNNPEHLDEVALGFPDLTIIAHHIGDPWNQMAVRLAARHRNLHLCTSAWSPRRYPAELLEFMAGKWHGTFGADKVIFGTDYPLLNLEKACRDARELDLPDSVLQRFLHDNAVELFWSGAR